MTEVDDWRPQRSLRPWGRAVLVLSALWTGLVWAGYAAAYGHGVPRGPDDAVRAALSVTILLTWLVTNIWLGRAHDAASWVAPRSQRHTRVWASIGWLVPLVNLWFPKGVVDDAWDALARLPGRPQRHGTGWWWLAWLLAAFGTTPSVYDGGYEPRGAVTLGFAVALTVAWLLWARVVSGLTVAYDGPRR